MKAIFQLSCYVVLLLLPRSTIVANYKYHHNNNYNDNTMKRSAIGMSSRALLGTTTAIHGFEMKNVVSVRLMKQQQKLLLNEKNRGNHFARQLFTAATARYGRTSTTNLYYYNPQYQHHDREMSKITEAKNVERLRKKFEQQQKGTDPKPKKKEPYEWLPFWTTPERDPYDSIYIQDPIAEKDCTPLRLYIPTEDDMTEVGTMCAMLFLTTPNLDTYESMPNNGDVIFLKGDLGSGKSVFARGFVRGALGDWNIDVPSPTYLLSNTYFASDKKGSNKNLEYVHEKNVFLFVSIGCITLCISTIYISLTIRFID